MNDKFNEQKEILLSLKHEISLLHQQVDYLLRNEKALGLLDLDVLMNRTHTIYDRLCSINLGEPINNNDDMEVDDDMIRSLFGVNADEEEQTVNEEETSEKVEEQEETVDIQEEKEPVEQPVLEEAIQEEKEKPVQEQDENTEATEQPIEINLMAENQPEEPKAEESDTDPNDYGFIFKFEPDTETVAFENKNQDGEPSVYTSGDEIEMTIPHLEFPETSETPETETIEATIDKTRENTQETAENPEEPEEPEIPEPIELPSEKPFIDLPDEPVIELQPDKVVEEEIEYEPVIFGDMEEKEDGGFELETPETLGDKLQQEEDRSLASKLQNRAVNDLRNAIGINDKFLLVNELFGGSMEKYNKSIENLNDLKTLNGALIYMNELRIELQWNSNNEAYKKLLDLVHRKFDN